ncbi:WW/Rsp5/WWP [Cordyceps javanica]|uniref:WW/Rsp5/WWP n=1 Tax=Cordyceps javanica TaxID=43265 RepID=A0A545VP82_9HYPO|nr:WW/Rsp5/WWP [Cordyceps javanica]TQW03508.1 WW/Rsp5/WWP [Cordyceps javanica]
MAGLSLLTYLPPGWTEATYEAATSTEYNALPEDELEKLMERKVEETRQKTMQILHEAKLWRATHGLATLSMHGTAGPVAAPGEAEAEAEAEADVSLDNTQRLVRRVEAAQWAEIGFLVFRTYYADEGLWEHFQQRFGEVVDRGIVAAAAPPGGGLARISSRVKLPLVSDYALVDLGPGGIAHIYRDSVSNLAGDGDDEEEEDSEDDDEEEGEKEEEEEDDGGHLASLDPGLRMPMCLMVDEECLRSMRADDPDDPDAATAAPFVKAVDAKLATNKDLHYAGWFRVSVQALVPRFYAAVQFYEPVEISAAVDESTGIWTGMKSPPSSREDEEATTALKK